MNNGTHNPVGVLINRARQAYAGGDFQRTIAICDGLIARLGRSHGSVADLLNLKAISLINMGRLEEAGAVLRNALKIKPAMAGAQANAARVCAGLGQHRDARRHAAKACRLAPSEPAVLYTAAQALRDSGDHEHAMRATRRILEVSPEHADAWHLKGSLELDTGDLEAAAESLDRTVTLAPGDTRALATLVKLKRFTMSDEDMVGRLKAIRSGSLPASDRSSAVFALAGMNQRAGKHQEAFSLYREANRLSASGRAFNVAQYDRGVDTTIEMTKQAVDRDAEPDPAGEHLVFIIGMPRSGTTLVEQIVSAHSELMGAGELTAMERIEQELQRAGAIPFLSDGPSAPNARQLKSGREHYLSLLPEGHSDFARVSDKAPMNFQRVAMIHRLFPAARFLYCVRHPLDTILSCFFHDFRHGMGFTFKLEHLTRVYAAHVRLMRHWQSLFGASIHVVSYPELVQNLETGVRAIAEFLELEFETAMLTPHLNPRVVSTASSVQVRAPVHDSALGVWKNYRGELEPVIAYLQQAGILTATEDEEPDGPILGV